MWTVFCLVSFWPFEVFTSECNTRLLQVVKYHKEYQTQYASLEIAEYIFYSDLFVDCAEAAAFSLSLYLSLNANNMRQFPLEVFCMVGPYFTCLRKIKEFKFHE
jgi:hypothetical protein